MVNKTTILFAGLVVILGVGCFAVQQVSGVISVQSPINMNYGTITNLGTSGGDYEAVNGSYLRSSLDPIYIQLSGILTTSQDYGRFGVASTLYEGTTQLSNKYLGKTAKAANTDELDGYDSSDYQKMVWGTCSPGSAISEIDSFGGVTCETDDIGMSTSQDYGRSGVATNLYEGSQTLSNLYLGKTAKAASTWKLDGYGYNHYLRTTGTAADTNKLDGYDSTGFQKQVSGYCSYGYAIRKIYSGGSVDCQDVIAMWRRDPLASNDIYYPDGNVAIGKSQADYPLDIKGTLAVSGTKNFVIDHPLKQGKKLIHSTLEGPEAAVFYRGEAQLTNGKAVIELPEYFEALTRKKGRTVLLTPKLESEDEPVSGLAASSVKDGKFKVKAIDNSNPEQKFYWEVKAVRADIEPLEAERTAGELGKSENQ